MQVPNEIAKFVELAQKQYVEAFNNQDSNGLFETSYALTRVYSVIGNIVLAGRWASECEKHTQDASKILSINMLLLCGLIRQKYLKPR